MPREFSERQESTEIFQKSHHLLKLNLMVFVLPDFLELDQLLGPIITHKDVFVPSGLPRAKVWKPICP